MAPNCPTLHGARRRREAGREDRPGRGVDGRDGGAAVVRAQDLVARLGREQADVGARAPHARQVAARRVRRNRDGVPRVAAVGRLEDGVAVADRVAGRRVGEEDAPQPAQDRGLQHPVVGVVGRAEQVAAGEGESRGVVDEEEVGRDGTCRPRRPRCPGSPACRRTSRRRRWSWTRCRQPAPRSPSGRTGSAAPRRPTGSPTRGPRTARGGSSARRRRSGASRTRRRRSQCRSRRRAAPSGWRSDRSARPPSPVRRCRCAAACRTRRRHSRRPARTRAGVSVLPCGCGLAHFQPEWPASTSPWLHAGAAVAPSAASAAATDRKLPDHLNRPLLPGAWRPRTRFRAWFAEPSRRSKQGSTAQVAVRKGGGRSRTLPTSSAESVIPANSIQPSAPKPATASTIPPATAPIM